MEILYICSLEVFLWYVKYTTLYFLTDNIGSNTIVTNGSGDLVERNFYTPFGVSLDDNTASDRLYENKEYDKVTRTYDFNFRMFNGENGPPIFLQPDTLIPNVYNPQDLNRYMFENGNPYNKVDKDGHYGWSVLYFAAGGWPMLVLAGLAFVGVMIYLHQTKDKEGPSETKSVAVKTDSVMHAKDYDKPQSEMHSASDDAMESSNLKTQDTTTKQAQVKELEVTFDWEKEKENAELNKVSDNKMKQQIDNVEKTQQQQKQSGGNKGSSTYGSSGSSGGIQDYRQSSWNKIVARLKSVWKSRSSKKN